MPRPTADPLNAITRATAALTNTDKLRAEQLARRDQLIDKAISGGTKWKAVEAATGLHANAISKARQRARAARGE